MAMAENEKGDTASSKEGGAWGTLEELLLACAVSRHGTESWDSIAMELQKRANSGNKNSHGENYRNDFSNSFTPQNCEQKYHALKRRFEVTGGCEEEEFRQRLSFMVDKLRKLRVDELRCQVERHDVSIVSLQLKVKRLEDERKKSSSSEPEVGEADLVAQVDRSEADEGKARGSEEEVAEDGSFNESNSNQREEANQNPALPVAESAPEKDCSSSRGGDDGSYDLEKGRVVFGKASPPSRLGNSGESVSESKREARQSSDVQSSASLSRRKRRGWGVGSSGDEEMETETEEWSHPSNKRKDVKSQSQPLIKLLEIVRSHKHGSVFQRRLPSQETEKYRNLIRQYLDLESVQSKLDGGVYSECHPKFYRDLLLIFTNAVLFFCKSSTEHAAARELRKLVMKEIIAQRVARNPEPTLVVKPDLEPKNLDPVVKKPRSSTNIVVCRRRTNSNATKPPPLLLSEKSSAKSKEEEAKVEILDTKPPKNNASSGDRKGKGESNNSNNNNKAKNDESSDEEEQPINMRRKQLLSSSSSRKQGVVNFLKRMQQNSPSSNEVMAKPSNDTEELEEQRTRKKGEMSKKKVVVGKKKDEDDEATKKRISGRRSGKGDEMEKPETTLRRGGGRPPKRKAAIGGGGGTPDSGRLKMRRDGDDKEVVGSGKIASTAKRSRR